MAIFIYLSVLFNTYTMTHSLTHVICTIYTYIFYVQVKSKNGAASCPFQLVVYWKCEKNHTDMKVDYKYNSHAMASASPLLNLTVAVPVDGGVKNMQSKPAGQWYESVIKTIKF